MRKNEILSSLTELIGEDISDSSNIDNVNGWDSFKCVLILSFIQEVLGRQLNESEFGVVTSAAAIVDIIEKETL